VSEGGSSGFKGANGRRRRNSVAEDAAENPAHVVERSGNGKRFAFTAIPGGSQPGRSPARQRMYRRQDPQMTGRNFCRGGLLPSSRSHSRSCGRRSWCSTVARAVACGPHLASFRGLKEWRGANASSSLATRCPACDSSLRSVAPLHTVCIPVHALQQCFALSSGPPCADPRSTGGAQTAYVSSRCPHQSHRTAHLERYSGRFRPVELGGATAATHARASRHGGQSTSRRRT